MSHKPPSPKMERPFDGLCCADYTRIARVFMGLTHIKLNIANPARPKRAVELSFLVDSGAVYSVIPSALLRKLGVRPHSKRTFTLADGSEITRKIGDVLFRLNGRRGAAPVIFGEKQDSVSLGTVSLEALGMMLDPINRQLRPLPMLLVLHTPSLTLSASVLSAPEFPYHFPYRRHNSQRAALRGICSYQWSHTAVPRRTCQLSSTA